MNLSLINIEWAFLSPNETENQPREVSALHEQQLATRLGLNSTQETVETSFGSRQRWWWALRWQTMAYRGFLSCGVVVAWKKQEQTLLFSSLVAIEDPLKPPIVCKWWSGWVWWFCWDSRLQQNIITADNSFSPLLFFSNQKKKLALWWTVADVCWDQE